MATVPVKEDAFLASQCLDFCQMLAGKSLSFSFSLKIGTNFSFSLDTRGEAALSFAKKKQTPSTMRRNARRREQFLQKKLASPAPVLNSVSEKGTQALQKAPISLHHHPSPPPASERRQVITVGKGKVATFNQLDGADSPPAKSVDGEGIALSTSEDDLVLPLEICHNCGKDMSPTHLCEDSGQEDPVETVACDYCEKAFDSEDDFNDHLCAPFKCDQCEKAFYCEEELKNHSASEFHSTRVIMQCDK